MPDQGRREPRLWTWFADAALLFALAAGLIWPIYQAEYLDAWSSIESTFIADARYLREHWPSPGWQPNWYCGTRFDYVYPPALRYGTAALSRWLDVSTARAYHLYISLLYSIGISGVYVFVRSGSGSRFPAIWAAVASATISPAFLFLEHFRQDYQGLYWMPIRLGVLIRYGEGPHMSAFALLPLSLAAAWYGLRRRHPAHLAASAFLAALVVSNNFYGATALAILFPILAWSVWLAEQDWRVWLRAAGIAVLAWSLTASWLTPSYFQVTLRNMRLVSRPGHVWSALLLAIVVLLYLALTWKLARGKTHRTWGTFVAGAIALFSLNVLGQHYFDFRVIGEPERLVPELDLTFFLGAAALMSWLASRSRWFRMAVVLLALLALVPGKGYVRRAWRVLPPSDTPQDRVEFQITNWMNRNLPNLRAFATGSVRFWYNAWHDLPQLGGGSEQGLMNLNTTAAYYQAAAGTNVEVAVAWLKAMGTGAVIVHDKTSAEIFHDYAAPEMYEGILPKVYDDHAGNRIYRVPRRFSHPARIVDARGMRALPVTEIEPGLDLLGKYVDLVEQGPDSEINFSRMNQRAIRIQTHLAAGQLLLVQETFDTAWTARSGRRLVPIMQDMMGFLLIDPGPGEHDILLQFEAPLENRVGTAASVTGIAIVIWLLVKGFARSKT
jgi:hypothetical protein